MDLTLAQASKAVGVDEHAFEGWEKGQVPRKSHWPKLERVLRVSVWEYTSTKYLTNYVPKPEEKKSAYAAACTVAMLLTTDEKRRLVEFLTCQTDEKK